MERLNILDPLGILGAAKHDVDRIAQSAFTLPIQGPPLGIGKKKGTIGNPIPVEYNGHLVDMKQKARDQLISVGYSEPIVDKALKWYEEWIMGLARRLAPGDTELQRKVVQTAYAEVTPQAERWIRGIQEAFSVPAAA